MEKDELIDNIFVEVLAYQLGYNLSSFAVIIAIVVFLIDYVE